MNKIRAMFNKITKPTFIGIVILFISITAIVFTSLILYNRTVNILTQNLRDRLLTISITQATNIDAKNLEALQTKDDWQKPEWARVVNRLHMAKYSNTDIVFMYIFRYTTDPKDDPIKMEFVADADSIDPYANTSGDSSRYVDVNRDGKIEPDGPDKLQWPGQPYPEAIDIPEIYEAYNGPIAVKDLYTDEYGTVLTGYAPIKDENGNTVAILATDIKADDFFTITRQTLQPFLIFIGFLSSIISILILIIIYSGKKYDKYLQKINENEKLQREKFEELANRFENVNHILAHDIKNVLGKNRDMFVETLAGTFGEITDQGKGFLKRLGRDTSDLITSVTNILKSGDEIKPNPQPFDFKQAVLDAVASVQDKANEGKIKIETQIDEKEDYTVNADSSLIVPHVLKNLLENAVNYNVVNGSIWINLSKKDSKTILLTIKDTGWGMTEDDQKVLFKPGGHGPDSIKRNVHTSGFGLAIAKQTMDVHNGKIYGISEGRDKGSTFFVELPVNQIAQEKVS